MHPPELLMILLIRSIWSKLSGLISKVSPTLAVGILGVIFSGNGFEETARSKKRLLYSGISTSDLRT